MLGGRSRVVRWEPLGTLAGRRWNVLVPCALAVTLALLADVPRPLRDWVQDPAWERVVLGLVVWVLAWLFCLILQDRLREVGPLQVGEGLRADIWTEIEALRREEAELERMADELDDVDARLEAVEECLVGQGLLGRSVGPGEGT